MTLALRTRPRALVLVLVLALGAAAFAASQAYAQEPTGAAAAKDCPNAPLTDPYTIGDTVTCAFVVANRGFFPAEVTALTETRPYPGGAPVPVTCMLADGTTEIAIGDTLPPTTLCAASFEVTIPNDPALCNTLYRDRVDIALEYNQFPAPLRATAFATHGLAIVCGPEITVTETATALSKVGDDVTYTIEICNVGFIEVTRDSVSDTLFGDISASFAASLAPGECSEAQLTRTVAPGDPDPLPDTVTASYSGLLLTATATAGTNTDVFQPGVDVTKSCTPDPVEVGEDETCTIVVANTGSPDSPDLENGTIEDTLTGDLLDAANPAVASSDCTPALPTGGTCTITTTRAVLDTDPNPLVNTVTVHYNPIGFPNDITDSASASVTVVVADITVTKVADEFSKVGDDVTYTIEVCNVGLSPVTRDSVIDTLLGDITASFAASLAPGACSEAVLTRTVLPDDLDPLENTVTATYSGAESQETATASAATNLFQPAVEVTKSCTPDPIEVGEDETCTIVVTNTGSPDSPDLENGTIDDTLTGDLLDPTNTAVASSDCTPALPTGGTCTITTTRAVLDTDPNPLVNTVTVHYNPIGFPNDITATASASVTIAEGPEPAITIEKKASHYSKVGDELDNLYKICNVGPIAVTRVSVIDELLGDITLSFAASLAPTECTEAHLMYTVQPGDPDPLNPSVTAIYSGAGSTATASDDAFTHLFQPAVEVTKSCTPDPIQVDEDEICTIVVTNTGSADSPGLVNGTIEDSLTGDLLDATNPAIDSSDCTPALSTGGTCTITTIRTVLDSDPNPLVNTVTVHYNPDGFPNDITDSAQASVTIEGRTGAGCTPGFWKHDQHLDSWVGYAPTDSFDDLFGVDVTLRAGGRVTIANPTLLDALAATGGGVNALARHAVAAVLNASAGVSSDFTPDEVIALVQDAVASGKYAEAKDLLAAANEQGCTLN